jgi:hypothetical protein
VVWTTAQQLELLALVAVVDDHVDLGVPFAGRRSTTKQTAPLRQKEGETIATCPRFEVLAIDTFWGLLRLRGVEPNSPSRFAEGSIAARRSWD